MASSLFHQKSGAARETRFLWRFGALFIAALSLRFGDLFAGAIPGIDDMMRLQQVRDLLDGQAWFNVDQARLLTPEGGEMHWSRLPDLFLAGSILVLRPFVGQSVAEILAIGIWPLLLLSAAMFSLCLIMRRLGIGMAGQLIGLFSFATSAAIFSFWPGRIDHHGFVVVLVLGGLAAILSRSMSARSGGLLALCVTAALSIAIEALPYAAGLIAMMGLFWIVRGHREGVRLATFGVSTMVCSTVFLVLDAPGLGAARAVCDAYGYSHWAGLAFGGGTLALLGVFGGWLDTWPKRLLAGAFAGSLTLALFVSVNPACLGDPYAAVPESVRQSWLSAVAEARSLSYVLRVEPDRAISVFGFLGASVVATIWMIARSAPHVRLGRIGFALLLGLAIIATVWQLRGQSFSHVFAAIAAGAAAGFAFEHWLAKRGSLALLVFAGICLVLSPIVWRSIAAPFAIPPAPTDASDVSRYDCVEADNFEILAQHPKLRIHTPIDLGIPILVRSEHEVFVGPYHRNVKGIERANMVLIGPTDLARQRLVGMGATHLAYCVGLNETDRYERLWPDGFAAQMNKGNLPDWLVPVDGLTETRGVVRLYQVQTE